MADNEIIFGLEPLALNSEGLLQVDSIYMADGVDYSSLPGMSYDSISEEYIIPLIADDEGPDIVIQLAQKPVADFSAEPLEGEISVDVQFTFTGTQGDSQLWDFGDGQTSTDLNPLHTYTEGIYDVKVTVSDWIANHSEYIQKNAYIEITAPANMWYDLTGEGYWLVYVEENESYYPDENWAIPYDDYGDGFAWVIPITISDYVFFPKPSASWHQNFVCAGIRATVQAYNRGIRLSVIENDNSTFFSLWFNDESDVVYDSTTDRMSFEILFDEDINMDNIKLFDFDAENEDGTSYALYGGVRTISLYGRYV